MAGLPGPQQSLRTRLEVVPKDIRLVALRAYNEAVRLALQKPVDVVALQQAQQRVQQLTEVYAMNRTLGVETALAQAQAKVECLR